MKNLKNQALVGAAAGIAVLSALGLAQKAGSSPGSAGGADVQEPAFTGTIRLPQEAPGHKDAGGESAEAAGYGALARVTQDRAVQAAQLYLKTTAAPSKVALDDENGFLVWEVVIGGQELKVDAGDGRVLHAAKADAEEGESGDDAAGGETEAEETGGK